ncbi:hypothetical protein T492DRAFT_484585 [Pavlovales sp. CCMP2436]|nr:hypothetical protein T492DRAFT_484585 [Pavlovales sp. CCMP2436]
MRSQRAVAELATREASVLSHRASAGYVYRRQLYRLALKLQRERGWLENGTEASEAYARLRGSDRRQAASENYYREQIALLEVCAYLGGGVKEIRKRTWGGGGDRPRPRTTTASRSRCSRFVHIWGGGDRFVSIVYLKFVILLGEGKIDRAA